MTELFQNVLTASFHGSIVILVVLLLRPLLKKTPKKFLCLLWLLAGIRLLMPFEIQSGLSLQPDVEPQMPQKIAQAMYNDRVITEVNPLPLPEKEFQTNAEIEFMIPANPDSQQMPQNAPEPELLIQLDTVAAYLWAAVACCFGLYTLLAYLGLRLQVREAIRLKDNIWECDRIETAFILGFIRPKIYLPMGMSRSNRRHILAHEQTHLEKGDHWIKMVGFVALALHWFNPLVWVAYILLCKDIEMACDERVVQFMDLEERKLYSAALLHCSTNHAHFAACPVAFGEVSVKERVLSVLNYKKPSFWISMAGILAIIFVAVCLVTSPIAEQPAGETTEPENAVKVTTVDEFLAAIAPDANILLEAGSYNLCDASDYGQKKATGYYTWEEEYDGYSLVIRDVENLTISGSGIHSTQLVTMPRWADVLTLRNCTGVGLSGITMGHIDGYGECSGGVLTVDNSTKVDMNRLGLYGCGVIGLEVYTSTDVTMTDCDIYECSSSAVSMADSENVTVSGCRMYTIGREYYGGWTYLDVSNCRNVMVSDCQMTDSSLYYLASVNQSQVTVKNNQFKNNRTEGGAFQITGEGVVLDGNQFDGTNVRFWFANSDFTAVDSKGNALTEAKMQELYGTKVIAPTQPQLEIHVSTVDELLAAIGPNKDIVLDAALYDFSTATGYGTTVSDYYIWEDIFDGPGLVIQNVDNMTIRSADGNTKAHTLAAIPRYANVLTFKACSNITLSGFTAGHTKEPGSCAGGVLYFQDSDRLIVDNCGLFGCGILGVQSDCCSDLTVKNCEIYECSQGGIQIWSTMGVTLENNTFRDIGGNSIMNFSGCFDVTLDGASIDGNATIATPEQEQVNALRSMAFDFLNFYFGNEPSGVKDFLSETYTGEVVAYTDGVCNWDCDYEMFTYDVVKQIGEKGSYTFSIPFWKQMDDPNKGALSVTVVRENDQYKVSNYHVEG